MAQPIDRSSKIAVAKNRQVSRATPYAIPPQHRYLTEADVGFFEPSTSQNRRKSNNPRHNIRDALFPTPPSTSSSSTTSSPPNTFNLDGEADRYHDPSVDINTQPAVFSMNHQAIDHSRGALEHGSESPSMSDEDKCSETDNLALNHPAMPIEEELVYNTIKASTSSEMTYKEKNEEECYKSNDSSSSAEIPFKEKPQEEYYSSSSAGMPYNGTEKLCEFFKNHPSYMSYIRGHIISGAQPLLRVPPPGDNPVGMDQSTPHYQDTLLSDLTSQRNQSRKKPDLRIVPVLRCKICYYFVLCYIPEVDVKLQYIYGNRKLIDHCFRLNQKHVIIEKDNEGKEKARKEVEIERLDILYSGLCTEDVATSLSNRIRGDRCCVLLATSPDEAFHSAYIARILRENRICGIDVPDPLNYCALALPVYRFLLKKLSNIAPGLYPNSSSCEKDLIILLFMGSITCVLPLLAKKNKRSRSNQAS